MPSRAKGSIDWQRVRNVLWRWRFRAIDTAERKLLDRALRSNPDRYRHARIAAANACGWDDVF